MPKPINKACILYMPEKGNVEMSSWFASPDVAYTWLLELRSIKSHVIALPSDIDTAAELEARGVPMGEGYALPRGAMHDIQRYGIYYPRWNQVVYGFRWQGLKPLRTFAIALYDKADDSTFKKLNRKYVGYYPSEDESHAWAYSALSATLKAAADFDPREWKDITIHRCHYLTSGGAFSDRMLIQAADNVFARRNPRRRKR